MTQNRSSAVMQQRSEAKTRVDLTGRTIGRLLVIERAPNNNRGVVWRCTCDCGAEVLVARKELRNGDTASCGCLRVDVTKGRATTHGHSVRREVTRTLQCFRNMHRRCYDPNCGKWDRYGGRGIFVCERWHEFSNFLADMGEQPAGLTIERVDNDGNYEPGNCRWATRQEQARNRHAPCRKRLELEGDYPA